MSRSDSDIITITTNRFDDIMTSVKKEQNYNKKKEYTNIY